MQPSSSTLEEAPLLSKCRSCGQKRKLAAYGINQLPDEMLIHILSSLNLKEAVRTSVLSSRWRYLWCLSGNVDLDLDCWIAKHNKRIKAHRFEKLVNRIIKSHKAPSLHKFIVRCSKMLEGGTIGVCDWIRFAMQKNARVFRLDLQSQDFPDLQILKSFYGFSRLCHQLEQYLHFGKLGALSELEMEGTYCFSFTYFVQVHSNYSRHLEKLVWRNNYMVPTSTNVFDVFPSRLPLPQLECLKHLELVTSTYASLVYFLLLTNACPLLATFVVQGVKHDRSCPMIKTPTLQNYRSENAQEFLKRHRHEHLKVVKLIDIGLFRSEFRFAFGLIQIAKSIEKLIIVPGPLVRATERMAAVRERAKQLEDYP